MTTEKTFELEFDGRKKGAIGKKESFRLVVKANDASDAIDKLYDMGYSNIRPYKSKEVSDVNEQIVDGYGNPNKAPAKVGDVVVDVNTNEHKEGKITDINYGFPEKLDAKNKPDEQFLQEKFGLDIARKMWWVAVDGDEAMPYGDDGVMLKMDAEKDDRLEEEVLTPERYPQWLRDNTKKLREEYKDYVKDFEDSEHEPMSFEEWSKVYFDNKHEFNESAKTNELDSVIKIVGSKEKLLKMLDNPDLMDEYFDKLFEYYMDSNLMPYGTAKAKSGDPYEWVYKRLDSLTSKKQVKEVEKIEESRSLLKDVQDEATTTDEKKPEPPPVETKEKQEEPKQSEPIKKVLNVPVSNLATILKSTKTKEEIVKQVVDFLKKENPNFNDVEFTKYVGVTTSEEATPEETEDNK